MRFPLKPKPKHGDTRIVKRFAWLPVEVEEQFVWLERYSSHQKYTQAFYIDKEGILCVGYGWQFGVDTDGWHEVERRLL